MSDVQAVLSSHNHRLFTQVNFKLILLDTLGALVACAAARIQGE